MRTAILTMTMLVWLTSCTKKTSEPTEVSASEILPDKPISFGYKCAWIAVRAKDTKEVADFINLKEQSPMNWAKGIEDSYTDRIFVTPPVDSLVFIIGITLPAMGTDEDIKNAKALVNKLSAKFGTADLFVTNRIVELHGWMRSVKGEVKRAYCFIGESGENLIVEGEPTNFEKQFDLVNTFSKEAAADNYFDKAGLVVPDEEFVMKVAGAWGINPSILEQRTDLKEGLGIIGRL